MLMVKTLFRRCIALGSLGAIVGLALGYLGWHHPAFDTFAHLRFHLALALLAGFFLLLLSRYRRMSALAFGVILFAFYTSLPGLKIAGQRLDRIPDQPEYELLHLNLLWNHDQPASVVEWIRQLDPDLLSLAEASRVWAPHLKRLEIRYPYFFNCPETGKRGGVRIYSRLPFAPGADYCAYYGVFGTTRITTPDGDHFTLGSLHLRWPWPASGPKQLEGILPELKDLDEDALIAGDFNATTWSFALQQFADAGQLTIVEGIGPTWLFEEFPSFVAEWFGFPIDNVLYKGRIRLLEANKLPSVGSDHHPILVRFQLAKSP